MGSVKRGRRTKHGREAVLKEIQDSLRDTSSTYSAEDAATAVQLAVNEACFVANKERVASRIAGGGMEDAVRDALDAAIDELVFYREAIFGKKSADPAPPDAVGV